MPTGPGTGLTRLRLPATVRWGPSREQEVPHIDRRTSTRVITVAFLLVWLVASVARAQAGASIHLAIDGGTYPGTFDVTTDAPCRVYDIGTDEWEITLDDPDQAPSYLYLLVDVGEYGSLTVSFPDGGGYDAYDLDVSVDEG